VTVAFVDGIYPCTKYVKQLYISL